MTDIFLYKIDFITGSYKEQSYRINFSNYQEHLRFSSLAVIKMTTQLKLFQTTENYTLH